MGWRGCGFVHHSKTIFSASALLRPEAALLLSAGCQILPPPISRYQFKFQSNLVWDLIKPKSNFCFRF
jgi:hypothetical protein